MQSVSKQNVNFWINYACAKDSWKHKQKTSIVLTEQFSYSSCLRGDFFYSVRVLFAKHETEKFSNCTFSSAPLIQVILMSGVNMNGLCRKFSPCVQTANEIWKHMISNIYRGHKWHIWCEALSASCSSQAGACIMTDIKQSHSHCWCVPSEHTPAPRLTPVNQIRQSM